MRAVYFAQADASGRGRAYCAHWLGNGHNIVIFGAESVAAMEDWPIWQYGTIDCHIN
jgi:hypothetical protein